MSDKCQACQSVRLEPAILASASIQPERASAWRKAIAAAEVKCRVCLDCGALDQLRADVQQLAKMLE
jgi:hypothetical protein